MLSHGEIWMKNFKVQKLHRTYVSAEEVERQNGLQKQI